ncbi:MAG: hypothetical protein U0793_08520 [Gemmataceae bacterium]
MATLTEQLETMRGLNENWDGYGAAAPRGEIVELAREFVALIEALTRKRGAGWEIHVSPTRVGGVLIEWDDGETEHEVDISPDQTFAFLHLTKATGHIETSLVGAPDVRATASTRAEALAKLESAISKRLDQGELVMLEVRRRGLAGLFGKFRDDPTLREICEEAYRERDADAQRWKP